MILHCVLPHKYNQLFRILNINNTHILCTREQYYIWRHSQHTATERPRLLPPHIEMVLKEIVWSTRITMSGILKKSTKVSVTWLPSVGEQRKWMIRSKQTRGTCSFVLITWNEHFCFALRVIGNKVVLKQTKTVVWNSIKWKIQLTIKHHVRKNQNVMTLPLARVYILPTMLHTNVQPFWNSCFDFKHRLCHSNKL